MSRPSVFGPAMDLLSQEKEPETQKVHEFPVVQKDVVKTSTYLPGPVYETLREIAFAERCKIHDLLVEGIDAILEKRRYPTFEELKNKKG